MPAVLAATRRPILIAIVIIAAMDEYFMRRADEILQSIRYATIATCDAQGNPWNSPVYSARDDAGNIYWISDKRSQHSQNIRGNPSVFLVFYDSTVPPGAGEGIYIRARASELSDPAEIQRARNIITGADATSSDTFSGGSTQRIYRAVPTDAWVNTAEINDGTFIRDYRVGIPLPALTKTGRPGPGI